MFRQCRLYYCGGTASPSSSSVGGRIGSIGSNGGGGNTTWFNRAVRFASISFALTFGFTGITILSWPLVDGKFLPWCYKRSIALSGPQFLPPERVRHREEILQELKALFLTSSDDDTSTRRSSHNNVDSGKEHDGSSSSTDGGRIDDRAIAKKEGFTIFENGTRPINASAGNIVVVTGPPQSGKSSLLRSLASSSSSNSARNTKKKSISTNDDVENQNDDSNKDNHDDDGDPAFKFIYINCRAYTEPSTMLYGTLTTALTPLSFLGGIVLAYHKLFNAFIDMLTMNQQHYHVSYIMFAQVLQHLRAGCRRWRKEQLSSNGDGEGGGGGGGGASKPILILDGFERLLSLKQETESYSAEASFPVKLLLDILVRSAVDEGLCHVLVLADSEALSSVAGSRRSHYYAEDGGNGGGGGANSSTGSGGGGGQQPWSLSSTNFFAQCPQLTERAVFRSLHYSSAAAADGGGGEQKLQSEETIQSHNNNSKSSKTKLSKKKQQQQHDFVVHDPFGDIRRNKEILLCLTRQEGSMPLLYSEIMRLLSSSSSSSSSPWREASVSSSDESTTTKLSPPPAVVGVDLPYFVEELGGPSPSNVLECLHQLVRERIVYPVVGRPLGFNSGTGGTGGGNSGERELRGGSPALSFQLTTPFVPATTNKSVSEQESPTCCSFLVPFWTSIDASRISLDLYLRNYEESLFSFGPGIPRDYYVSIPARYCSTVPGFMRQLRWGKNYHWWWWRPVIVTRSSAENKVTTTTTAGYRRTIVDDPTSLLTLRNGEVLEGYSPLWYKLLLLPLMGVPTLL